MPTFYYPHPILARPHDMRGSRALNTNYQNGARTMFLKVYIEAEITNVNQEVHCMLSMDDALPGLWAKDGYRIDQNMLAAVGFREFSLSAMIPPYYYYRIDEFSSLGVVHTIFGWEETTL